MKRLIIFFTFLLLATSLKAQLNINLWSGNVTQNNGQRGMVTGGIAMQLYTSFTDTSSANSYSAGVLKLIPGCIIRVGDDMYMRSTDLQKWNKINSSGATGVSSVGLTVTTPASPAFSVSNSPITTSGNIALNVLGNSGQLINGAGALISSLPAALTPTWQQTLTAGSTLNTNNTIVNNATQQTFTWTNLGANTGITFSHSGTMSSGQTLSLFSETGTGTGTSYAQRIENLRTGSGTNVGVKITANGKASNTALWVDTGRVVVGGSNVGAAGAKLNVIADNIRLNNDPLNGIMVTNSTPATVTDTIQNSPNLTWYGSAWASSASPQLRNLYFSAYAVPVNGVSEITGRLKFYSWINSVEVTEALGLGEHGQIYVNDGDPGTSGQVLSSQGSSATAKWITPTTGTVTSIATTSPITGGTITSTGTIACPTCVTSAAALTLNNLVIGGGLQASSTTTTGTGVLTALGINVGSAGAFVTFNGALGTPSSGTGTNITGIPEGGLSLTDITTNNTSTTKHGFFPKLTANSIYYVSNAGALTALTVGAAGTVLTGNGVTSAPSWQTPSSFSLTNGNGTTANSTAVDLGGTITSDININDNSSGTNQFNIGSGTSVRNFRVTATNTIELNGIDVTIGTLAGTGTRAVLADDNGVLSAPISDRRAKNSILPLKDAVDKLMKLQPSTFYYNAEYKRFGKGQQVGFIAQEVNTVLPNSTYFNKDGLMGYNEIDLLPLAISALQQALIRIDALEKEVKKLKKP